LAGHKVSLSFIVRNATTKPLSFPDLSARPHLVHFLLTDENGKQQKRFNTPPTQDSDERWTLAPRTQRKVQLLLPSGGALTAGVYELAIEIADDLATTTVLGPSPLALQPPDPIQIDGPINVVNLGTTSGSLVWLQRASTGADVYLQTGLQGGRAQANRNWHLLHLPEPEEVHITHGRSADAKTRHLYWKSGKDLIYAKLQGRAIEDDRTHRVGLPYPDWSLLGRGVTSGAGRLLVPIWVPAPKGRLGEIRIVVVDERTGARFHRFIDAQRKPLWTHTGIDAGGALRMLLVGDQGLTQWSLRAEGLPEIPGAGARLTPKDHSVKGAVYASLPDVGPDAKGKGIFAWSLQKGLVQARWLTLGGTNVHELPSRDLPPGWSLERAFPHADTLRFTARDPAGVLHLVSERAPRSVPKLSHGESLQLNRNGDPYLVLRQAGQGIVIRPLP